MTIHSRYQLAMQTNVGGIGWRYEFNAISDVGALDRAKKLLSPGNLPPSCTAVYLWNVTSKDSEVEIASFKVKPAEVILA